MIRWNHANNDPITILPLIFLPQNKTTQPTPHTPGQVESLPPTSTLIRTGERLRAPGGSECMFGAQRRGRLYDDFMLFLYVHRESSVLVNELPEKSDEFRFLHPV